MHTPSRLRVAATLVVLVASSMMLPACGWIARRLAAELALQPFERKFTVIGGKATAFRACLTASGGGCTAADALAAPGAAPSFATTPLETNLSGLGSTDLTASGTRLESAAERALRHPVQVRLNQLYNALSGLPAAETSGFAVVPAEGGGSAVELAFSLREVDDYTRLLAEATEADDWNALANQANALSAGSWTQVLTGYLAAYLNAYFRGGEFLKIDAASPTAVAALRQRYPLLSQAELEAFAESLSNPWTFGSLGATGLVTRSGAVYQFPAMEFRIDPFAGRVARGSDIDLPLIAADLTRVVLEAVFDAHDQLPAVTGATGCGVAVAPLPLHDPDQSPVSATDFTAVNRVSNQAEAAVSSAVGPAIRGAGWVSLNNEALARIIETIVAVTVRKVTEKAAWCWYACDLAASTALTQPAERMELRLIVTGDRASS